MATADVLTTLQEEFKKPDLLELLNRDRKFEKQFCDATLKAQTKCFAVHRVVLVLMSLFFRNLFRTEMKEKYAAVIEIKMTDEQLGRLLDCIYTDDVQITNKNALELYGDADYTQIEFLKLRCAKFILQMVGIDNCLEILAYAQRYNLTEIEERAKQVIYENFDTILHQDQFKRLDFDAMSAIINHQNTKKQGESVFTGIIQWVHFKLSSRKEHFVELFSQLDLSTLSCEFLQTTVIDEILVSEDVVCCRAVMKAMRNFRPKPQPKPQESTKLLVVGGFPSKKQCLLIDVATEQKEVLPQTIVPVYHATAVKFMNKIFVFGGNGKNMKSCQMFDLTDRTWTTLADMPEGRRNAVCAVLNGLIYVTGGRDNNRYLSTCIIYDPDNNSWSKGLGLRQPRVGHAMVEFEGSLFVIGGWNGSSSCLNSCEKFSDNRWSAIQHMNEPRLGVSVAAFQGNIYATCGFGFKHERGLTTVERYDPRSNSWTQVRPTNVGRMYHASCVLQGKLHVICGDDETSVEVYDPQENKWTVCSHTDDVADFGCVVAV